MTPSFATRGVRRYRYYVCTQAQRHGWNSCPSKSIPAGQIEAFVVDQIRRIGRDPQLQASILAEAEGLHRRQRDELDAEDAVVLRDLEQAHTELRKLVTSLTPQPESSLLARMADLQQGIARRDARRQEIAGERQRIDESRLDPAEAAEWLARFDPVWDSLTPQEKTQVARILLERVEYDGAAETVSVQFRPTGLQTLMDELEGEEP